MNCSAAAPPVLFDLDGTLVDSVADLTVSANATLDHFGLKPLAEDQVASYIGDGARKLLERCLGGAGSDADVGQALRLFREHYLGQCTQLTRPYPGVIEGLRALAGRPMAIVTNKPEPMAVRIAEALNMTEWLGTVVGARPKVAVKPDPALLEFALENLGTRDESENAARGWMVGDSANDVRAGKALGMQTIAVSWGFTPRSELEALGADHVVDDFAAVVSIVHAV